MWENAKTPAGAGKLHSFIPRASIERPANPGRAFHREHQIPARHQQRPRNKEDVLKLCMPDAIAGFQVPALKLAKMSAEPALVANRTDDAFH